MKCKFYVLVLLFSSFFYSCLVDIPGEKSNNPDVYIPPVINNKLSDSLIQLFEVNTQVTTDTRNSDRIKTYSVTKAPYFLGFTDLIKYKNKWLLSFRFSDGHVANNFGHVIIMESEDFKTWNLSQIFTQKDFDLRDPKLFIADSSLCLHFHSASIHPYHGETRNDYISFYNVSKGNWEEPRKINKNTNIKSWFWRIAYNKNKFYTVSYINGLNLYTSSNGLQFNNTYNFENLPELSETAIRFRNDSIYTVSRGKSISLISKASTDSLTNWVNVTEIPIELGGPNFLFYKDKMIMTGRDHKKGTMVLFSYNLNTNKTSSIVTLPSQLETGYSGMYIEGETLYLSYYTGITTGRYSINVSTVDLQIFDD